MMMKNHPEEIKTILTNSSMPITDIDRYIKKEIKANDRHWFITTVIICLVTFIVCSANIKPSKGEIMDAARPLVDSLQKSMQHTVDSLIIINSNTK